MLFREKKVILLYLVFFLFVVLAFWFYFFKAKAKDVSTIKFKKLEFLSPTITPHKYFDSKSEKGLDLTTSNSTSVTKNLTNQVSLTISKNCDEKKGHYPIQPSHLDNILCKDGSLASPYPASYRPKVIELASFLGPDYYVRKGVAVRADIGEEERIKKMLDEFYEKAKSQGPPYSCIPYIIYGYRSYDEQARLYNNHKCAQSKTWCGVAPPGYSAHQSGVAIDIGCVKISCNQLASDGTCSNVKLEMNWNNNVINYFKESEFRNYGFIHPIPEDPPHFIFID